MDNFDLKKFLVENKLTVNSKLAETQEVDESWKDVALGAATLASVGASAKDLDKVADKEPVKITADANDNAFVKLSPEEAFDFFMKSAKETGFAKAAKIAASTGTAQDSSEGQLKRNLISLLNLAANMEEGEDFTPQQKITLGNFLKKNAQYAKVLLAAIKGNAVGIK